MKRRARGYILVHTLIVVAGLVALMAGFAASQRAALGETQARLRLRRAEMAARSGVARALAELEIADTNVAQSIDTWAGLGLDGTMAYSLGDSSYRIQIVDGGSMLNINDATEEQLQALPLTQSQIECLLDWRESSQQPRVEGAKDETYNQMSPPYNTRLGRLETLSELLLVKGWVARDLYAPITDISTTATLPSDVDGGILPLASMLTTQSGCPNTRADGTSRVNLNQRNLRPDTLIQAGLDQALIEQIMLRAPITSYEQLLTLPGITLDSFRSLLEVVTFTNSSRLTGKLNINTASQAALETIPGMTRALATEIVQQQSTGFGTLGDLANLTSASEMVLAQVADRLTVGADTWVVRVYGECGDVGVPLEVTVRVTNGSAGVLLWERVSSGGPPQWWNWNSTSVQTVDMETGE